MNRGRPIRRRAHRAPAWRLAPVAVAALAGITSLSGSAAGAVVPASAGTGFGRATEISPPANAAAEPGTGLYAAACTGHGDCVAGGSYSDRAGQDEAMVVTQMKGRWGRAIEVVPPKGAADQPDAEVNGIACASQGNCVAVGYYNVKADYDQGFIVDQTRGRWGHAIQAELPLNARAEAAGLTTVTCTSAGNCEAGGYYFDRAGGLEATIVSEVRGRWRRGTELSMGHGFDADPGPTIGAIACARAGYCVAVGFYYISTVGPPFSTAALGFIQARGKWYPGTKVTPPSNADGNSGLSGVACAAGGACFAVGTYATSATVYSAMSALESGNRWRQAASIPTTPAHATSDSLDGISCPSVRLCVVAGGYGTATSNTLGMLITLSNEKWGKAGGVAVPANGATTPRDFLSSVGCASDGYCAAVGFYQTKTDGDVAMVAERA
jgi:hypothetical protein